LIAALEIPRGNQSNFQSLTDNRLLHGHRIELRLDNLGLLIDNDMISCMNHRRRYGRRSVLTDPVARVFSGLNLPGEVLPRRV
jgi:hypothetical protein